ncbi:MAG TPA: thioredoxin family protein [Perlabentimonas sp.]|nr:thioredoxin family protein [Bacteroidales bacterium]MDD4673652.1 thioredoxin family protein [Bacteroidales bacterium]HZJ73389.1 thioredoxin family protein [Perlabentimonas sp.]
MKKMLLLLSMIVLAAATTFGQGYKIGDKAMDFSLKNVDGKMVSMSNYSDAKGFVVIFSCNHCPYVIAYEDRIIDLHKKYAPKGYPVIAINPNNPEVQPQDSYEKMIERANEKNFPFAYLFDQGQKVYPIYGATKTPHVYLLNKKGNDLIVEYIGTIDNNYRDASQVTETYLADAIDALLAGEKPSITETKAIGCTIKVKK